MLSTVTLMFAVFLAAILQGEESPGSVYSIMPQRWLLILLHYGAASFHLPSVSTANINTVQHPKPYSNMKYQPTQLLWYPRCCFLSPTSWQPLFKFLSGSSPGLPTYNNHHAIDLQFTVYSMWWFPAHLHKDLPNMSNYQNTLHCSLLISTDNILCVLQVLRRKVAYKQGIFYFFFFKSSKPMKSVRREVLYKIHMYFLETGKAMFWNKEML